MLESQRERYSECSTWLWLPIINAIMALAAVIVAGTAIYLSVKASNNGLKADFVTTKFNATLAGVCGTYPIDVLIGKVGGWAIVQVPRFLCDGTANSSDYIGGLRFALPAGYDASVLFSVGGVLQYPENARYVQWCTGGPNATSCDVFNNSQAAVVGSTVYMGASTTAGDTFLPPSLPYGPARDFTLLYATANYSAAVVSSAPSAENAIPASAMTMIALGTGLTLILIS